MVLAGAPAVAPHLLSRSWLRPPQGAAQASRPIRLSQEDLPPLPRDCAERLRVFRKLGSGAALLLEGQGWNKQAELFLGC